MAKVSIEALVAGHLCLDLIPEWTSEDVRIEPGKLIQVGPALVSTGGTVSNAGIALHKLGAKVGLCALVGDDVFGREVVRKVEAEGAGLSAGLTIDPQATTSYTVVMNPPRVDRSFLHSPGANDFFGSQHVPDSLLDSPDLRVVHLGYPPLMRRIYEDDGAELVKLLKRIRERGVTVSLDMSYPDPGSQAGAVDWVRWHEAVLPYVDIYTPSIEELVIMLERRFWSALHDIHGEHVLEALVGPDVDRLADRCLGFGAAMVVVKCGHLGVRLFAANEGRLLQAGRLLRPVAQQWADLKLAQPVYSVQVEGTTGTGDATVAGLLLGLLRGAYPEGTVRLACAVGACCCEAPDATSGIPSLDEVVRRFELESYLAAGS